MLRIVSLAPLALFTSALVACAGDTGPQGPEGEQGPPGSSGGATDGGFDAAAFAGPSGPSGAMGAMGAMGAKGEKGAMGAMGDVGTMGDMGDPGDDGASGPTGPSGTSGPSGPSGPQGPLLASAGMTGATPLNVYSYFMNTGVNGTNYNFGQAKLQTNGVAGQFLVCGDSGAIATFNYVAIVNGTRTAGTVAANGCSAPFDAGAGGDFTVTIRRSIIFGVHSGDGTANENYNIYGFSQL